MNNAQTPKLSLDMVIFEQIASKKKAMNSIATDDNVQLMQTRIVPVPSMAITFAHVLYTYRVAIVMYQYGQFLLV